MKNTGDGMMRLRSVQYARSVHLHATEHCNIITLYYCTTFDSNVFTVVQYIIHYARKYMFCKTVRTPVVGLLHVSFIQYILF